MSLARHGRLGWRMIELDALHINEGHGVQAQRLQSGLEQKLKRKVAAGNLPRTRLDYGGGFFGSTFLK